MNFDQRNPIIRLIEEKAISVNNDGKCIKSAVLPTKAAINPIKNVYSINRCKFASPLKVKRALTKKENITAAIKANVLDTV